MRQLGFKLAALGAASILAACGGGGGSPAPTITGLAATGAALANATLTAQCVSGDPLTGTTNADGTFNLQLDGTRATPCIVKATSGSTTLFSYASGPGRINVTPLTDLAVTRALGADPASVFSTFNAATAAKLEAGLPAAKSYVQTFAGGQTGLAPTGDPITGAFAIGDANDKVLDALGAALKTNSQTLASLRTAVQPAAALAATAARGKLISAPVTVATLPAAAITQAVTDSGLIALTGAAVCDVKVVSLNYNTIGVVGESTNASGVMLVPSGTGCVPNGALVAYAKGTDVQKPRTLANPTDQETFLLAAMYAAQGFNVVATDYLGFAQSTYKYHPYLHADSEASSVIDSIRAARNAATVVGSTVAANGKVMLNGYSQGGHSSMAAQRAIERDNAAEINVVAGAHMAGPYNLSGSFKLTDAIAGYQFFVPYLVTAWQKVYGNIYDNVNTVFKAPYATGIENLLPSPDLTYTTLVTTGKVPGASGETPNQARDALFQPAFLADVRTNNNNPVYLDGKKNDLLGWNPKAAMQLCGGAGDPTVPPAVHRDVAYADFAARGFTNVTTVDVDANVKGAYGAVLASSPATYFGNYHGTYEPPFCHASARMLFAGVLASPQ